MSSQIVAQQLDPGLVDACGPSPGFICEFVYDRTGNETAAELVAWLVERPLKIVLIFIAAYLLNRFLRRLIDRALARMLQQREEPPQELEAEGPLAVLQQRAIEKAQELATRTERSRQRAQTLGAVLRTATSVAVFSIAVMMALAEIDVNLGPLIAGAGIVGIALGFGAQTIVRDFLSGIFMLAEDQYGVGDIIDVGEASGVVEQVGLRTTRIRDVNGTLWFFPNGEIRRVANKSQEWARAVLDLDVAYDTDLEKASRVIKETADALWMEGHPEATILEEPKLMGVEAFAADSIKLRVSVKVEPKEQFTTARILRRRLKEAFDREGIEIPFPQRTVWMRTVESGTDSGPEAEEA